MCGIAGEIRFDGSVGDLAITKAMCDAQIHRGPDDEGYYANGPISLGIRRLATTDLRKGLYPLRNEESTIHLVFDGEICNSRELRTELDGHGHRFRSKTDAEVLVHSYEEWSTSCLQRMNGMFAFALWDEQRELLWIARDHFGIKPLYYHQTDRSLAFASEIKPLLKHPDVSAEPNDRVIRRYLQSGDLDNTDETFFEGIKRLPPAHFLLIDRDGIAERERYWRPRFSRVIDGKITAEEVKRIQHLFLEGIEKHAASGMPVGAYLSGGIDLSSVVCGLRRVLTESGSSEQRITTFSAVFPGESVDEAEYVKAVCDAANAEYNPVTPTAKELWDDLPTLVRCQEEPFIGSSVYAQWRVMKCAKERGVKVILNGHGNDVLYGGFPLDYLSYLLMLMRHKKCRKLVVEGLLSRDVTKPLVKAYFPDLVRAVTRYWTSLIIRGRTATSRAFLGDVQSELVRKVFQRPPDDLAALLELTLTSSTPTNLRYEDKNSMWHSIQSRSPLFYKPYFEYAAQLPLDTKLRNGWTKYIFRLAMKGILPEKVRLRRTKIGFETPEKKWIEEELRTEIQEYFSKPNPRTAKYYNSEAVRTLLDADRLTDYEIRLIWRILNFEVWYREFFGEVKASGGGKRPWTTLDENTTPHPARSSGFTSKT